MFCIIPLDFLTPYVSKAVSLPLAQVCYFMLFFLVRWTEKSKDAVSMWFMGKEVGLECQVITGTSFYIGGMFVGWFKVWEVFKQLILKLE